MEEKVFNIIFFHDVAKSIHRFQYFICDCFDGYVK